MGPANRALAARKDLDFNAGWRFVKEDVAGAHEEDFDDSDWRKLGLPHDWSIEGPFGADLASGTGYLPGGIGWYRKTFRLDEALEGRRVRIEFDGVYKCSEVWCNGVSVGMSAFAQNDGFVPLFDGTTLDGWHAVPQDSAPDWRVRDGVIAGHGSADRLSYLVWKEEDLTDFELELQYRLPGKGNTGVEIRSQPDPSGKRPFEGYHADLGHAGIGPHILGAWDFHFARRKEPPCPRGTKLVIDEKGRFHSSAIPGALVLADVRQHEWNHVRIVARGNRFQFFINGKLTSEFTDNAKRGQLDHGAIGLQIHDKGMQVEFKDIRLKRLAG